MTVKENKKGAASALFLAIALFCAGFAGYFYYALGGTGIFTMAVAVICAVLCVKKIFQVSFLRIEDDGFLVQKGGKNAKFYFKDIKQISIHEIDAKRKIDVLNVKFKKGEPNLTRRSKFNTELKDVKFSAFYPFFLDCRMRTYRR